MIHPLTAVPPGPCQDRLVDVGSVPVDTAGALGEAGQAVLHYYHEYSQLKFSVEQNNTNRHRVSILKNQTLRHYCSTTIEVL